MIDVVFVVRLGRRGKNLKSSIQLCTLRTITSSTASRGMQFIIVFFLYLQILLFLLSIK